MDITPIVQAVIGLAAAVITAFVVPFIKSKTTVEQREAIWEIIKTAVTAAEQMKNLNTGISKKSYVNRFIAGKGIRLDPVEIDTMIESAVYELKSKGGVGDARL